jgi:hypothetical protein
MLMEPLEKTENTNEKIEALKRALIGVTNKRVEALLLMNATPEEYLHDVVEYLWILNGINKTGRKN